MSEQFADTDALGSVLAAHSVGAFSGTDTACSCDRKWRTNESYSEHLAEVVRAVVTGLAPRLLAWSEENPDHPLSGRDVAYFLRGELVVRPGQAQA